MTIVAYAEDMTKEVPMSIVTLIPAELTHEGHTYAIDENDGYPALYQDGEQVKDVDWTDTFKASWCGDPKSQPITAALVAAELKLQAEWFGQFS